MLEDESGVKILDWFLDLIFPKYCVSCNVEGDWICSKCYKKIIQIKKPFCPYCNRLTSQGNFCANCRKKSFLSGVIIAAHYQEGPLKEAIHNYKYNGVHSMTPYLGQIIFKVIRDHQKIINPVIIPVPLSRKRLAERGYNQSELLAKYLYKKIPSSSLNTKIIKKIKHMPTQVSLNRSQRLQNPINTFSYCGHKGELNKKIVLLVDDIYTTGATLQNCAKLIKKYNRPKSLWAIVLAKA